MTDDIQKVREAYEAAARAVGFVPCCDHLGDFFAALAKRLQPRPVPVKKTWQASPAVALKFATEWHRHTISAGVLADYRKPINAIAPDIIRERPDLVAAEWLRRWNAAYPDSHLARGLDNHHCRKLFPELDP